MPNIKNPSFGGSRFSRRLVIYGGLILLVILGILLYHNNHKQHIISGSNEAIASPLLRQYLENKDYYTYQIRQGTFANSYIMDKQYTNAKTVLDEVISNVPKDKIISKTYYTFWYLYQQNGDTKNRKKYALLTAEKLRQEGDPTTAAVFEKDANGN